MNVDRIGAASLQRSSGNPRRRCRRRARYFNVVEPITTFVDLQRWIELELDTRTILQHLEANRVRSADKFFWVDSQVEVVEEQIVVRLIRSVRTAGGRRASVP